SVRYTSSRVLSSRGYNVLQAYDGRHCLRELLKARGQVDLILLDIMMPDLNGIMLFNAIRRRYPNIKVIFLSALQPPEPVKDLLKSEGHIANITKPFDYDRLVDAVNGALE
ncbi:MAG: response regulator, partial [Candidatus Altiarchaeota archaeon]|nr:response regulator [Candidatus Altiarchaeota archaeon]